ncbi:MAG: hypothetical protein NTZ78_09590 [Candidatus Aureabacteria bacterium]|nr:hypothetical protein [Candidatus Auribacterota bacterium]
MKRVTVAAVSVMFAVGLCGMVIAGSLDSPGAPSVGSGMHTIGQLYDYLNSGTASSIPSGFQEPAGTPGPTMKTMEEIYQDIKAKFDDCEATAANVESGVHFFSAVPGNWGVQTGTLVVPPTPTITPTITSTPIALTWAGTTHSENECVALGGTVYDTGATGTICKLSGSNIGCSTGWTQAESWQSYGSTIWGGDACGLHKSTGSIDFQNTSSNCNLSGSYCFNQSQAWNCASNPKPELWATCVNCAQFNCVDVASNCSWNRVAVGCY